MHSKNEGLTVGELTIVIGTLLIIFLVWSGVTKKQDSQTKLNSNNSYHIILKS